MPSTADIKRIINSVKSIQQITKAMKVVSAAKLQRTQAAVLASRPYAGKLEEVMSRIAANAGDYSHPLMEARKVKQVGIILFTSDGGLSGGYNSNIIKKAIFEEERWRPIEVSYIAVGRKGRDFLRRRGKEIKGEFIGIKDVPTFQESHSITKLALELYTSGVVEEIYLAYQEFISVVKQRPMFKRLLPIGCGEQEPKPEGDRLPNEYLYEPPPEQLLDVLISKHINNIIFEVLREAKASEFGSQMVSMTTATDNANKIIGELTLSFNRARKAAITKEITEIIGGANALQNEDPIEIEPS